MSHLGIGLMRLAALLPLPWVRFLGACLGHALFLAAARRRHIVYANLQACFPDLVKAKRNALARRVFVRFAQAWVDRGWLWHGRVELLRRRLNVVGNLEGLQGKQPTLIFWPHFVGLDAGWTALALRLDRPLATLYARQANPVFDRWIVRGRMRFGNVRLFQRHDGPKPLLATLRAGTLLCLLPDMNYGARESIFVPFFGVQAATVTSLSRFAKLGRAKVVPVLTRLTDDGYAVEVLDAWQDFPGDDLRADTARMNLQLEDYVRACPDQYYWVHRRFKSRPDGEPPLY
jgi:KDO2-lipid IV(A) lauroyltransferase